LLWSAQERAVPNRDRSPGSSRNPDPIRFDLGLNLLGGLRLPSARGLLLLRSRAIALLEAGAAAGIAPLLEGRRKVVAAAISADQLLRPGPRTR
jgi:hypothetical protein